LLKASSPSPGFRPQCRSGNPPPGLDVEGWRRAQRSRYDQRMTNPILLAVLTLAMMMTGGALAEQRTFYDSSGKVVGRSSSNSSGTTTNYDSRGRVISRETTSRNRTTIYDAAGRLVGRWQ
jgi:YD repeat-containing protein